VRVSTSDAEVSLNLRSELDVLDHLRRVIFLCSDDVSPELMAGGGKTPVTYRQVKIFINKDILNFNVPMSAVEGVTVYKRREELVKDKSEHLLWQGFSYTGHQVGEIPVTSERSNDEFLAMPHETLDVEVRMV